MGADKYVCFEGQWRVALLNAPECTGVVSGWKVLKTIDVTLSPSEAMVGGWKVLKTIDITLSPSGSVSGGWKVLKTIDVTLSPGGGTTPPNGEEPQKEPFPWELLLAGGLGVGAVVLLAPPKKKASKT